MPYAIVIVILAWMSINIPKCWSLLYSSNPWNGNICERSKPLSAQGPPNWWEEMTLNQTKLKMKWHKIKAKNVLSKGYYFMGGAHKKGYTFNAHKTWKNESCYNFNLSRNW
jgi:hypothetical protein